MIELTAIVAAIVGIVEVIKRAANLNSSNAPLLALILGVAWFVFTGELTTAENIFAGVVAGLTASGLFSGVKATVK